MLDWIDIALRLTAAALVGAAIGLNRDLRGKRAGVRTLGVVGLSSALAVMAVSNLSATADVNAADISRIIQGVLTGIGFLGAGVIFREESGQGVQGLTTAACIWLTACIGVVCGVGAWRTVAIAIPLTFAVLVFGGPVEKFFHERLGQSNSDED